MVEAAKGPDEKEALAAQAVAAKGPDERGGFGGSRRCGGGDGEGTGRAGGFGDLAVDGIAGRGPALEGSGRPVQDRDRPELHGDVGDDLELDPADLNQIARLQGQSLTWENALPVDESPPGLL